MGASAPQTIHPPYPPSRKRVTPPPSYTDKAVVVTPVSTGFVLTAKVARSWHFRDRASMRRFQQREGLFA